MDKHPIVIVGGESLLGRELRDVLAEQSLLGKTGLVGAEDSVDTGAAEGDEPAIVSPLDEKNLIGARVVLLAGSPGTTRKAFELASSASPQPALIDMTYALEDHPQARLRAPRLEPDGYLARPGAIHSVSHPAAQTLAMFVTAVHAGHPIRGSVAVVFEPASERGQRGIHELQQQTVGLLSFKHVPKDVFDSQLSFNMLARLGSDSPFSLAEIEGRIERHLASLLNLAGSGASAGSAAGSTPPVQPAVGRGLPRDRRLAGAPPMPSLRLVQAPVFHGYSFSVWVEFQDTPSVERLRETLAAAGADVRGDDLDPPSNVGVAGQSGFAAGAIESDPNNPRACWFWLAADNLRLSAEAGVAIARQTLGSGK